VLNWRLMGVATCTRRIGQGDHDTGEPAVDVFQDELVMFKRDEPAVGAVGDFAAECQAQVEKAPCPLQIGQRLCV
jgi:hypothetical protein